MNGDAQAAVSAAPEGEFPPALAGARWLVDALGALIDEDQSLRERVAALKHDLGKYVAWTSANLEEAAWEGPVEDALIDALFGDLLETRKRPGGAETAWEVWERLAGDLRRPLAQPELAEVDEAVSELQAAEAAVRARDARAIADLRGRIREAQLRIRRELSNLHRRLVRG